MNDLFALFRHSAAGLRALLLLTVITGLAYPLIVLGVAQVTMPWQADGSLITTTGAHTTDPSKAAGSALIGQLVHDDSLFQPRPSAAGDGYDMTSTYGSNLGPEEPALIKDIEQRQQEISAREDVPVSAIPADAVTASGSGLDPDISPAYAAIQVPRVARETGLPRATVRKLVDENTHGRVLGFLGDEHVNVLRLNIAVKRAAD